MVRRCVAGGCSNTATDQIPKDSKVSRLWNKFVKIRRADWKLHTVHSEICSEHFCAKDFDSPTSMWQEFGIKRRRFLLPTAVPSKQAISNTGQTQPSSQPVGNSTIPNERPSKKLKINTDGDKQADTHTQSFSHNSTERSAFRKREHQRLIAAALNPFPV